MIEGLKIDVKASEMKEVMNDRVKYHEQRVIFFNKEAQRLTEEAKQGHKSAAEEDGSITMSNVRETIDRHYQRAATHKRKAAYFKFVADHVIENEWYRLSEEDLTRLEILDRYMF